MSPFVYKRYMVITVITSNNHPDPLLFTSNLIIENTTELDSLSDLKYSNIQGSGP
jgi:hypothetical protein